MAICANLTHNLYLQDCNNPLAPGVDGSNGYIINFDDIDLDSSVVTTDRVITSLVLKSGKYAYRIQTDPDGIEPVWKYEPGAYRRDQVSMMMGVKIFDNSTTVKKRIVDISKGKFVVVLENNGIKNNPTLPEVKGDNKYEAWGWDTGLVIGGETQRDANDQDTGGGINLQLTTSDRKKENGPPYSIFITSLSVTEAMLEALINPLSP